jgi:hypothetical protein
MSEKSEQVQPVEPVGPVESAEPVESEGARSQAQAESPVTRGWGKQLVGAVIGMLVTALAMQIGPALGWQPPDNRTMVLLIGGAIGATMFTLDRFEHAGSRLTRRTEGSTARLVNVLVGLLGLLVVTSLIWMLTASVGWLIDQFR